METSSNAILSWLNVRARTVIFQSLPPSRTRQKNRVILRYVDCAGQEQTVGGATVGAAVIIAMTRERTGRRADGQLSGAHLEA